MTRNPGGSVKRRRALITGITGQDGAYLAQFLIAKGYEVYGTYRRTSSPNFWRLSTLGVGESVRLIPADMTDSMSLYRALEESQPDEVYNLAAQSFVEASFDNPLMTANVDALGVVRLLELVRLRKGCRYYQASTSEIYGNETFDEFFLDVLDENSLKVPASPYAAAKFYGFNMVKIYREAYGMFASSGILFNHESPLRGLEFVTRKITNQAAKIALNIQKDKIELGDITTMRDWGYAPEYVEAMWLMLQQDEPDDFVIATGRARTVECFLEKVFEELGLDWREHVLSNVRENKRALDVKYLRGDYTKAKKVLGWQSKVQMESLARLMVNADLNRWQAHLDGKTFPWDAPNAI